MFQHEKIFDSEFYSWPSMVDHQQLTIKIWTVKIRIVQILMVNYSGQLKSRSSTSGLHSTKMSNVMKKMGNFDAWFAGLWECFFFLWRKKEGWKIDENFDDCSRCLIFMSWDQSNSVWSSVGFWVRCVFQIFLKKYSSLSLYREFSIFFIRLFQEIK